MIEERDLLTQFALLDEDDTELPVPDDDVLEDEDEEEEEDEEDDPNDDWDEEK